MFIKIKVGDWGRIPFRASALAAIVLGSDLGIARVEGQEFRLTTGTEVTESIFVPLPGAGESNSTLTFEFGFSTDETAQQMTFPDSITFTLSDGNHLAYLVTADVLGTSWAPQTAGALAIDPASILRTEVLYADAPFSRSIAYSVSFSLPVELQGTSLTLGFSLFNNQDAIQSAGFLRNPMVVPEPAVLPTLLLGGVALWFHRKKQTLR